MEFVKREDHNIFEDEEYKGYADMLQKLHHIETTMGEFQNNPMIMEHIHQAMQNTLNANIVHNLQLPISPRQMSSMLKTNRNINFNTELPHIRNLTTALDSQDRQMRLNDEVPRNDIISNLNELELAHNLGALSDLPQEHTNIAHNLIRMNQELDLSHLNRIDLNQDDTRRMYDNQILDQRLPHHNVMHDHQTILPMPFQIKSEHDDERYFYDAANQFINNNPLSGHASIDQGVQNQNLQDQVLLYNNQLPPLNVPLSSVDFYSRTQSYLPNYPPDITRENPQNLVMNRQYNVGYDIDKQKENSIEDSQKIENEKLLNDPKDDQKNYQYDNNTEQLYIDKNENDSNVQNKVMQMQDNINYKNLIENEYAHIKGEYVCYKCNNIFPSKRGLKIHSKVCLENGENLSESSDKMGKFTCSQCPYKCQSPAILKIHERTHTGEKPFSCTFCDYKSGQKNNVAKHILVHMKEKPFRCQYCDYRCAQKNNLVVHERTHTGYKPFACSYCAYCDYRTVQKPNLVKHMYLHTDERPFSCDVCNYKCVQKTNLTKHKLRHLNERNDVADFSKINKPYRPRQKTVKCQYCPYSCVQKISLDKHMQYKHPEVQTDRQDIDQENLDGHINYKSPNVQTDKQCYEEENYRTINLLKDSDVIQNLSMRKFEENIVQDKPILENVIQDKPVLEPIPVQS
ncbi:Gastrula zinc finger protein XlCGF57.1 [Eumeta japonica]|uniref:Gastrula zinc finger protein XlCGF57.1 n=1 Tax=Eumeta variegata TaxID=151549 RepID=A0A4C1UWW7_EUMVA|nr:Gastrula zinc finger protein XlCGF57.1 [Eumeta japonica]